jgi:predicted RNase H-like nuclease (RuvC/YqgF family)
MSHLSDKEIIEQLEEEIERLRKKVDALYVGLAESKKSGAEAWSKLWKIEDIMRQLHELD